LSRRKSSCACNRHRHWLATTKKTKANQITSRSMQQADCPLFKFKPKQHNEQIFQDRRTPKAPQVNSKALKNYQVHDN